MNTLSKLIAAGTLATLAALPWLPSPMAWYLGLTNPKLVYETSQAVSEPEFEALAADLIREELSQLATTLVTEEEPLLRAAKVANLVATRSFQARSRYRHVAHFRKAGIRRYEGPATCLTCHPTALQEVVDSVHFRFQQTAAGFSTYGYDGRQLNAPGERAIPMGKIDRACGIPGTFSWIGWAELVASKPAHQNGKSVMRSEGCGQCHIGGNTHPATEMMMPGGQVPDQALQGLDCLICHSQTYDMNFRTVMEGDGGRRWGQDRTLRAALTVTRTTSQNCLWCHQHNMGGDTFAGNVAAANLGYANPRLLHHGAKRANPFSPAQDVHAAAGMNCTDCHVPEGHKIPRGTRGTDLVANDLPSKPVTCEGCHTATPHRKGEDRVLMNGHASRIACETCHIASLTDNSVVLRDWLHPVWNPEEGIYQPFDLYLSGRPGRGMIYLWFNGNGTFLANALGDNAKGDGRYDPFMTLMAQLDDPTVVDEVREQARVLQTHYPALDVEAYVQDATQPLRQLTPAQLAERRQVIRTKMQPLMARGDSKLYPFKVFNALMFEDLNNQGPFGGMILPFDYPTYYQTGNPERSLIAAMEKPVMRRMYEKPFKLYMMDEFMAWFGVSQWSGVYPLANGTLHQVEPRWMRQMGTLMVNHGIQKEGKGCKNCHAKQGGILNWELLGYSEAQVKALRHLPELQ